MKIFFGGAEYPRAIKTLIESSAQRVMFSFAASPAESTWILTNGMEVMVDSGAFTAWKQGKQIDILQYMDCLSKYKPNKYFNLDVVGDIESTIRNQKTMERAGFNPIPVFHFGEPMDLLEELVSKYQLIGLGGTVGQPISFKEQWFRQVFSLYPEVKFHGLGITSPRLLNQFPFESVDSTWWLFMYHDAGGRLTPNSAHFREEQRARVKQLLQYESKKYIKYQTSLAL